MDRHEGKLRLALALGSGGLKGMAHIGVLRALEEAEIRPTLYAGSSAGAVVAAAAAHGIGLADLEAIADRLWRKPVFQVDFLSLLRRVSVRPECTGAHRSEGSAMSSSARSGSGSSKPPWSSARWTSRAGPRPPELQSDEMTTETEMSAP